MQITGAELFVRALQKEKVDTLFAYPGGYVIGIFDALYKQKEIKTILPRHEQGLVHAADGYARSTGKTGVCLVTSGPGATNIVTGIATANYDSVPLVCFTGQVPTRLMGNDAFQEVDIVGITRGITKHSVIVTSREDLGRVIKEAFYIAQTGRPGPVVVDLPADIMGELGPTVYPKTIQMRSYKPDVNVHIGQLKRAVKLLSESKKPLFLVGGGIHRSRACEDMTRLAEKTGIPVITTIMGRGALPTDHPLYVGNLGMHGSYGVNKAVSECDLLFSIGTRFNDRITGKVDEFAPYAKIVHIDIDTAAISRNIEVDIPIVADAGQAITTLLDYVEPMDTATWRADIAAWSAEHPLAMPETAGLSPRRVIEAINELFPKSIVVTDVGQHQMWVAQFLKMNKDKTLLTSGGLGTMGFGLPAAIGAQLGNRDAHIISISGDGGVQMNIQELATAVLEGLPVINIILNNGYLGMVRQWQQLFYDRRYSSTNLHALGPDAALQGDYVPDFVKLAESYGALGMRITKDEEIVDALTAAGKERGRPSVIECIIDREALVLPMVRSGFALNSMILEVPQE